MGSRLAFNRSGSSRCSSMPATNRSRAGPLNRSALPSCWRPESRLVSVSRVAPASTLQLVDDASKSQVGGKLPGAQRPSLQLHAKTSAHLFCRRRRRRPVKLLGAPRDPTAGAAGKRSRSRCCRPGPRGRERRRAPSRVHAWAAPSTPLCHPRAPCFAPTRVSAHARERCWSAYI
jgi:hypothetical protein